jgi:hypothetical protein
MAAIKRLDVQDYRYGLRMLFAFAKVVQKCFLAYEDIAPEGNSSRAEERQTMSLGIWNCIAQNRCLCENCKKLQKIKKPHLASLPLWLCAKYANDRSIDLPHLVTKRTDELMDMLNVAPETELYRAPLFCFWPQCKQYEIQKLEIPGNFEIEELEMPAKRKEQEKKAHQYVTEQLLKDRKDDRYEFIVSISYGVALSVVAQDKSAKPFVVVIMRISENAINSHLDLRWVDTSQCDTIDLPIFADMESCLVDRDQAVPKLISERSIHAHIGIILSPDALIENQIIPFRDFELDASIK